MARRTGGRGRGHRCRRGSDHRRVCRDDGSIPVGAGHVRRPCTGRAGAAQCQPAGRERRPRPPRPPSPRRRHPAAAAPPTSATSPAPVPPNPLTVPRPDWLGQRVLPTHEDGYGEVQPTPFELVDRRFATIDLLPPPPDDTFLATVASVRPMCSRGRPGGPPARSVPTTSGTSPSRSGGSTGVPIPASCSSTPAGRGAGRRLRGTARGALPDRGDEDRDRRGPRQAAAPATATTRRRSSAGARPVDHVGRSRLRPGR